MDNIFDVTHFGAIGDDKTDCTKAFQNAINAATKVKGVVIVPPGIYLCGELKMREGVSIIGFSGWGYRETGGSVIKLNDVNAKCLFDLKEAYGARIKSLQLLGNNCLGNNIHCIDIEWDNYDSRMNDSLYREDNSLPEETQIGFREDSVIIEDCQIKNFSGDAIHLENIWAFTVRKCLIIANKGNGIWIKGWDGWITDNIFHTNHGAAVFSDTVCASITMTSNRIEWNRNGGLNLKNCNTINVTGNYFDRSYGPAIRLIEGDEECNNIAITGNVLNRSGKYHPSYDENEYENSHIYIDGASNIAITGNTFRIGKDDRNSGKLSPDYGIVYKHLNSCVITANVFNNGALKSSFVDLGEHRGTNIIKDNAE